MGQAELEAALRRDGDNKAREIWARVEAEAERLRTELATELQRERLAADAERESKILSLQAKHKAEMEQRAQRCRLDAEKALAERLWFLAGAQLAKLAVHGEAQLFQALAEEIPDHQWQQVWVNRCDRQAASELFPQAEIEETEEIIAGLIVQAEEGRIRIENSLSKRLHHLWPELLPELMAELRQRAGDDGALA